MEIWMFLLKKKYTLLVRSEPLLWPLWRHVPYMVSTELILYIIHTYILPRTQDHGIFEVGRDLWRWSSPTKCSPLGRLWCHIRLLSQSWNLKEWRLHNLWAAAHCLTTLMMRKLFLIFTLSLSFQFMPNNSHPPTNTVLGKAWLHLLNKPV